MMYMSETITFVPEYSAGDIEGYKMWRWNRSPYPVYVGFISVDNFEDEKTRQESYGYKIWVRDF